MKKLKRRAEKAAKANKAREAKVSKKFKKKQPRVKSKPIEKEEEEDVVPVPRVAPQDDDEVFSKERSRA